MASTTRQIIASGASAYHLQKKPNNPWISSRSRWNDARWEFDNETPGAGRFDSIVVWDFELPDGSNFLDTQWGSLLETFRRFTWSLLLDPRGGKQLKVGSMDAISAAIRYLVGWMVKRNYSSLSQFDGAASEEYLRGFDRCPAVYRVNTK